MSQVYPPNVIIKIIINDFFRYRELTLAARGLARDAVIPTFDDDRIISDMEQFHYVRLDAKRAVARGDRNWVIVLILSADGKYSHHSPDLRKLLEGIESERLAKDGYLDEVIIVAEESFFSKKNLTDVVRGFQSIQSDSPLYNAYPYYNFAFVVPEHKSVSPHRIMTQVEVDSLLIREHILRTDLAVILTNDAPIVWIGAREGQVIEITRDSQTAGIALYYRRVERAS